MVIFDQNTGNYLKEKNLILIQEAKAWETQIQGLYTDGRLIFKNKLSDMMSSCCPSVWSYRQEDQEYKAIPSYLVRQQPTAATINQKQNKTKKQKTNKQKKPKGKGLEKWLSN